MKLGRNDLCHCGSGKKYKKCCQAIDTEKQRSLKSLSGASAWLEHYVSAMQSQAQNAHKDNVQVQSAWGQWPKADESSQPFNDALFSQHVMFDLPMAGGNSLASNLTLETTNHSTQDIEALKDALGKTHLSALEVVACRRSKSITFKDRLTGASTTVPDAKLSEELDPMEVVIGRIAQWQNQNILLPGWERVYFRGRKAAIRDLEKQMLELELPEDDEEIRTVWLRREANSVVRRLRSASPEVNGV